MGCAPKLHIDFGLAIRDFMEFLEHGAIGSVILIPAPEFDKLLHGRHSLISIRRVTL